MVSGGVVDPGLVSSMKDALRKGLLVDKLGRTRSRWLSALGFVVVSSAMTTRRLQMVVRVIELM